MEGTIGRLSGAEAFFCGGPPWWFGFHAAADLPETVLDGHEADYLDYFLNQGVTGPNGMDPDIRRAFVAAYSGKEALRCAFEHYRAMPINAAQIEAATDSARRTHLKLDANVRRRRLATASR